MKTVKVFVIYDLTYWSSQLEDILDILRNNGLNIEYHSKSQLGTVMGTIDENKIPALRNINGVTRVWESHQYKPLN